MIGAAQWRGDRAEMPARHPEGGLSVMHPNENMQTVAKIRNKVRMLVAHEASFGVLSTGEKIAVAFVLDRFDLMHWWGTMLDGVDRLGPEWLRAAVYVQRYGWEVE
jgi:hypothetical protein